MRTIPKWMNKIHEAEKVEFSSIHSICFSPDGNQIVVAAGEKVMVYDPNDGALLQLLQAHKGPVHSVVYCSDGRKFASGSADKNVIIWTSKMEGVLKYSHSEAIQCLAYNPITYQLASCALSDFAFWSAEVKAVQKYRVVGRITCCAWTPNGQFLAIGLASGHVSIRDKTGDETQRINRDAPIWAITFSGSTLLVSDWNDYLSFYNLEGQQILKERHIGISALSLNMLGELVMIGGIGGWAILTSEGVILISTDQEWIWAVIPSPDMNHMAVACQDGTLWCYQIVFSTVHGLYRERYAYRENMTDVIIQHLTSGNKVRIKCHDRVQKIAIYKHRLAVQLPERVVVYEQGDVDGMLYRVKEKLPQKTECSLLVATSDALLLCQDTKLIMIGRKIPKVWMVPSPIRYVKVTNLYFEEVLLLGLLNGQIWQVEPKRNGSRLILETPESVRCFDVSTSRTRLAVVDEQSVCRVYNLPTSELLYLEENVSSVSWNSCCDELICLSGGGLLSIKAGNFPPSTQPLGGSVVGFQGGRVFCLQLNAMQTINVPLSHAVHQYVQHKMFADAYAVACLGVTAVEWEWLGFAALEELTFEVARKAFQRSENITLLNLIDNLQERLDSGEKRLSILGDILAYRGRYADAARNFRVAGRDDRALNLYIDLRMFNKAQEFVGEGEGGAALARRRAEWARHVNEPRAAAEMYLAAGDVQKAAQIMAETGKRDMLIELVRKLDKAASGPLRHVAEALVAVGDPTTAADVYERLGDFKKVAELAVLAGEWTRAFSLAKEHIECRAEVYIPYAHRMARDNNFVDAQKAYHMAGETSMALRVFAILVGNAISEERFSDAGYLHHLLAMQCLETANTKEKTERARLLNRYYDNDRLSRMYHAYDAVHRCIHEPFSLSQPDALLNAARYVLSLLGSGSPPIGISIFCLNLCLAKQAKALNASAIAKQTLDKILGLQIPQKFQESVELLILKTRAGGFPNSASSERLPLRDEEVAPLCWRCRRHAPLLSVLSCPHCKHYMAHSHATHEVLPLVQFIPTEGISDSEAIELLERTSLPETSENENIQNGTEILTFDEPIDHVDPFLEKVEEGDDSGVVLCSRQALLDLNPASVLIINLPPPLNKKFYRNMLPELPIIACQYCYKLFYMEDFEIQLVTKGQCPFCRHPSSTEISKDVDNNLEDSTNDDSMHPTSPINGLC